MKPRTKKLRPPKPRKVVLYVTEKDGRLECAVSRISTPFGSMYVQVDFDHDTGQLAGGSVSDPGKEPKAEVAKLVRAISAGLSKCLQAVGQYEADATTEAVREAQE